MKKYIAITFLTLAIGFLTISVTTTPHYKYHEFERSVQVEKWMTKPFNTDFYEEPLEIEDWMIRPFNTN